MIDLHGHYLPGVDDGAASLAEALEMCRLAAEDGCEAVVATPHQRTPLWSNTERAPLAELLEAVRRGAGEEPRILLGGEIRVDSELLTDVEAIPASGLLPLAGSRYLLLEFNRLGFGPDPEPVVHELAVAGWRPIVAHPEFIPALADDLPLLGRLVEAGALLQITAMSLTGAFGGEARSCVARMLDAGLVHFVASDAHDARSRPPGLGRAREEIAARWGEEAAERLTAANPRAVVEDRPLEAP